MEKALNRIIDIETRAEQIVAAAERVREGLADEIKAELTALEESARRRMEARLEIISQEESEWRQARICEIDENHRRDMDMLRGAEGMTEAWADELVAMILGEGAAGMRNV